MTSASVYERLQKARIIDRQGWGLYPKEKDEATRQPTDMCALDWLPQTIHVFFNHRIKLVVVIMRYPKEKDEATWHREFLRWTPIQSMLSRVGSSKHRVLASLKEERITCREYHRGAVLCMGIKRLPDSLFAHLNKAAMTQYVAACRRNATETVVAILVAHFGPGLNRQHGLHGGYERAFTKLLYTAQACESAGTPLTLVPALSGLCDAVCRTCERLLGRLQNAYDF